MTRLTFHHQEMAPTGRRRNDEHWISRRASDKPPQAAPKGNLPPPQHSKACMNFNPTLLQNKYARWIIFGVLMLLIAEPLHSFVLSQQSNNGFDLTGSLIPANQIHHGGPPRDGIPALTNPKFITASKADYIKPSDRVLGIVVGGKARAYPINILNHHEIVNDVINHQPVAITYCPLCGSGVAFD